MELPVVPRARWDREPVMHPDPHAAPLGSAAVLQVMGLRAVIERADAAGERPDPSKVLFVGEPEPRALLGDLLLARGAERRVALEIAAGSELGFAREGRSG